MSVLGLNFKSSLFVHPLHTCIGGSVFVSENEKVPECEHCGEYMAQILQLNHNNLPLNGSMISTGISRVFICTNYNCPLGVEKDEINVKILQTNDLMGLCDPDECSVTVFGEMSVFSQRVYNVDSSLLRDCPVRIDAGDNYTRITLKLHPLFNVKYRSSCDFDSIVDKINLEDTKDGLRFLRTKTRLESRPVKTTIEKISLIDSSKKNTGSVSESSSEEEDKTNIDDIFDSPIKETLRDFNREDPKPISRRRAKPGLIDNKYPPLVLKVATKNVKEFKTSFSKIVSK